MMTVCDDEETEENFTDSKQHDWSKDNKPASVLAEGVIIGTTFMKPSCVSVVAISEENLIRPLPSVNIVNSDPLAKVGTRFWFSFDKERMHSHVRLSHSWEDAPVSIAHIDMSPIHPKVLHRMLCSCAVSRKQSDSAHMQELLKVLADSQQHCAQTPYMLEGDNVHSSILTNVESDLVVYLKLRCWKEAQGTIPCSWQ